MGSGIHLGDPQRLRLRTVFFAIAPSALLWALLVGSVNRDEAMTGGFVVLLTTLLLYALRRCYPTQVSLRWQDLLQFLRIPWTVVRDAWSVTAVLVRDLFGGKPIPSLHRAVRWEHRSDEALLRGRGVLATAALSASPNTIVLGIDNGTSLMIFHQVKREPMDDLARSLGAKP